MLNSSKIIHILLITLLSLTYTSQIIHLAQSQIQAYIMLALYCLILFIYCIQTYISFHYPASSPHLHSVQLDINLIFAYKLTQERRRELVAALQTAKQSQRQQLQREYIEQYKKPSFCDICERVQPPRAYHCLKCDICVLQRQKHSNLLGLCIGANNLATYINYLLISKILYLYSFNTMAYVFLTTNRFYRLPIFYQWYFLCFVFFLAILSIAFFREFFLLMIRIQQNKTISEAQDPILRKLEYGRGRGSDSLSYWSRVKNVFNLSKLQQKSQWVDDIEDYIEIQV